MNRLTQIDRLALLAEWEIPDEHVSPSAALAKLGRLLTQLDSRRDALDLPPGSFHEAAAAAWEDEENAYVEIRLPWALDAPIDISAQGRTLFIRLAR